MLLLLTTLLAGAISTAALVPPPPAGDLLVSKRFHQNRFLISYWVGPQVPTPELDGRFAEIAAANFTGHLGFNGNGNSHGLYNDTGIHPTKERVSAEIALCDKYDLVCIPTLCGKIDLQAGVLPEECLHLGETSPNFWGFQLLDEPSASLFAKMGNFSKTLAAARPKALQYYNLLGSGAHNFANQTTYEQYWSSYIATVNPDVLSQDFYPEFQISRGEPLPTHVRESKERYAISLAVQRKQGLTHNVPFWNFLNAMPFSAEHADPTEAMLRWQVMTSLAYGASGYMYFCYWSPGVFSLGGGIIVPRGSTNVAGFEMVKGPHYYEAQRINSVAKIYGGFLLGRQSVGVFRADSVVSNVTNAVSPGVPYHTENGGSFWGTDKAPPQPTSPDCAIASLTGSGIRECDQNEWLIGQFDLTSAPEWGPASRLTPPPTHEIAILLTNHDENRNIWSTVEWADFINSSSVLELDPLHGVLAPLRDDSPWHVGTQVALDAGGARLFVLQRQKPPPQPVLHCDKKFGGTLVHIDCVSGGCDRHFNVSDKEYRDECCAEDKSGVVDKSWTCCVKSSLKMDDGDSAGATTNAGGGTLDRMQIDGGTRLTTCANASDCTAELQGALDGCAPEVVLTQLPNGRNWITRPLFVRNCGHAQRLELKPGVVLEAIKGGFHGGGDTLIEVSNVTDFTLHGPGATLRMHRSDYANRSLYSHSENRMAIALRGVTNAVISGEPGLPLTVTESGGDGCYIAHLFGSNPAQNSRNITIHDVNFTKHYRQGVSVIGVVGLTMINTELSLTAGTPPAAGIDFEPDMPSNELGGIVFTNVTARGNQGRGFQWTLHMLSPQTPSPVDVTFNDCTVLGGLSYGVSVSGNKVGLPPGGHITFNGLKATDTKRSAILVEDKPSSLQLNIIDATVDNVSAACIAPIWVEGMNSVCSGVHLCNVTVYDFVDRPAINLQGGAVHDVTGNLSVVNPTGCVSANISGRGNALKITCT